MTSSVIAQIKRDSTLTDLSLFVSEKSILNVDRELYFSGENIFFTVRNIINGNIANLDLSKVVYLELFDNQQSIIKEKFGIENGFTTGIIQIPRKITSGNYFLRAYTNYQRNDKPDSFFTRVIRIINPEQTLPSLQFSKDEHFKTAIKEGNLEIGKPTSVIFYIHPLLIVNSKNICLVNQLDSCVKILEPRQNGLGEFIFTPKDKEAYSIQINLIDGEFIQKKIAKIEAPLNVKIFRSNEFIRLNIGLKENLNDHKSDSLKLAILSPELKTIGVSKFKLNAGIASLRIEQSIFEAGINYLMIKNGNDAILSIQTYFQTSEDLVQVHLELNRTSFSPRELITVKLSIPELSTKASVSIAIVKKGTSNHKNHLNYSLIENPILLNSWVKNNELTPDLKYEIEMLLNLFKQEVNTQFYYNFFADVKESNIFWLPETRGVSISGILRHKITKAPEGNSKLILSSFGDEPQIHFTNTQSDGSFIFSLNHLNENQSLSIKIDEFNAEDLEILINNDFAEFPSLKTSTLWLNKMEQKVIQEMNLNLQLQLVFDIDKITNSIPKFAPNPWISDTTIYMKDYVVSDNMEQLIDEILPFVHARESDGEYSLKVQDKDVLSTYSSPFILLDNFPVSNVNELLKLNPKTIQKVSLTYSPYHSGNKRMNGIVSFFTDTDNFAGYPTNKSSVFLDFLTESRAKKMESPSYKTDEEISKTIPDFRNLLYWNPDLKFKNDTIISFYASDHCSEYDVIIKGITEDGKFITGKATILIEN